ncbi:MAG: FAD-dependent monooxygenase [Methanobacteriota archaeon]|nr:MAG: FAD-dependent monooxygenase [Euryarchaeota archaeon]
MPHQKVTIIGAGLAGSLLAIYLAKKGFRVEVYERRPDMRKEQISAGRSINLALSTRGIYALQEVGLAKTVLKSAIPMKGRMIHTRDGELLFQPYGKDESEVINSVSRGELNKVLMDTAEGFDNVSLYFNQKCKEVDFVRGEVLLYDEKYQEEKVIYTDTLIACDGAHSAVRLSMQKRGRFNLNQFYLEHGYKELTIPAGDDHHFQMEPHALHIWPRGTYMLIALPNPDASFTCTLFYPFEGKNSFATLDTPRKLTRFFNQEFPDALNLMPTLKHDFFANPTGNLVTVKCSPWHVGGKALLLGDAAHAIVPFYGQGMNCAFEDCTMLNHLIDKYGTDWEKVFREYEKQRKKDTDAIADLALDNFIEMRDKVADPVFQTKKKIELLLEQQFPGRFISKYGMVTFHRTPYSIAKKRGEAQEQILMDIARNITNPEEINPGEILKVVEEKLAQSKKG